MINICMPVQDWTAIPESKVPQALRKNGFRKKNRKIKKIICLNTLRKNGLRRKKSQNFFFPLF